MRLTSVSGALFPLAFFSVIDQAISQPRSFQPREGFVSSLPNGDISVFGGAIVMPASGNTRNEIDEPGGMITLSNGDRDLSCLVTIFRRRTYDFSRVRVAYEDTRSLVESREASLPGSSLLTRRDQSVPGLLASEATYRYFNRVRNGSDYSRTTTFGFMKEGVGFFGWRSCAWMANRPASLTEFNEASRRLQISVRFDQPASAGPLYGNAP